MFDSFAAQIDRITDFNAAAGDKIDLTGIDANINTAANDGFSFVGSAPFSRTAGELRLQVIDGRTFVEGDLDGDGFGDFALLVNFITLTSTDFYL